METFSVLLAICAGNSPVPSDFHTQRPVTQSFGVYCELRPNKRLSKQLWGWWFETPSHPSHPLWHHCNDSELWRYICGSRKYAFEETVEGPVKWDALMLIWCHLNALWFFYQKLLFVHHHGVFYIHTVYPKKYAHGFVVLCFVVVMQSFIINSHEVFIHIHQGCFAGTGAIVRLPQCQWSKPDGYGKISQCITTTKHSKAKTVCIFLGIYCIFVYIYYSSSHYQSH